MEGGLFKKYELRILKNKNDKQNIITYIEGKTGVCLHENEIVIEAKKIKIQTTSIKRSVLASKDIKTILKELGYSLS